MAKPAPIANVGDRVDFQGYYREGHLNLVGEVTARYELTGPHTHYAYTIRASGQDFYVFEDNVGTPNNVETA
jgi:hypothetical protein